MTEPILSFDEIRPYHDHEVKVVLEKLMEKPSFFSLMAYLFPQIPTNKLIASLKEINTTQDFQKQYIHKAIRGIVADSTQGLSYEGFAHLKKGESYLFLSNHRDIILDCAFLNILLVEHGYNTTRIAIGDNLMVSSLVTAMMKLNKSFIVHRSAPREKMLDYSRRLSAYISHSISKDGSSVWLAQRNGRTKDGDDKTHSGLLKMLGIHAESNYRETIKDLNIVPMALSYEYEPCDALKAEELVHLAKGLPYTKDDKLSMVQGIRDPKGRVHLSIGAPLKEEIEELNDISNRNKWVQSLAQLIDRHIYRQYKLWNTNYISYDLIHGGEKYADKYQPKQKEAFEAYMAQRLEWMKGSRKALKKQFLQIYANPVINRESLENN